MSKLIVRGCGIRKPCGVYIETPLSSSGMPVSDTLICKPVEIPEGLPVSDRGIAMFEADGVYHLLDVVGSSHYPSPSCFYEETRRFGLSRRCENIDYSKLTQDSLIFLAHRKARLVEGYELWHDDEKCPAGRKINDGDEKEACVRHIYIVERELLIDEEMHSSNGECVVSSGKVHMPAFEFTAYSVTGVEMVYDYGIFMRFPIGQITVIEDEQNGTHQKKLDSIGEISLPVVLAKS